MRFDPLHETVASHPFRPATPRTRTCPWGPRPTRKGWGTQPQNPRRTRIDWRGGFAAAERRFFAQPFPVTIEGALAIPTGRRNPHNGKRFTVADTKKIADKAERKKIKRTARKKAAPKAKRTTARGALKKKVKKMVRGQSKR